ncbi:MAG: MBL fold metallo-hydrolase [Sedimentisphaerales bacterium]|nr:MBL fold metallo-hydrolase [Sedimentisphaerales bacterium]
MMEAIRITTLVENISNHPTLLAEHGLAFWIEYGPHKILFDTGASQIIQTNASRLGVDLSQTEAVVLSHGHYDHTGGLMRILDIAPAARVYLHPEAIKPKFSCYDQKPCRSIGMPAMTARYLQERKGTDRLCWTPEPEEIFPGLWITGVIPRITDYEDVGGPFYLDAFRNQTDPLWDDQALFFDSEEGLVVILGCAHAGVVNTLHHIKDFTNQNRFFTILGGMHLGSASPERIARTIEAFRMYDVARIGPAHCTGMQAKAQLWHAFPDRCFNGSVGEKIEFPLVRSLPRAHL